MLIRTSVKNKLPYQWKCSACEQRFAPERDIELTASELKQLNSAFLEHFAEKHPGAPVFAPNQE
jgi:hypothetical protein